MTKRFEVVYEQNKILDSQITVYKDKETGVQYLFIKDGYSGGLTPLLDATGKPLLA